MGLIELPERKDLRLEKYDYTNPGAYFVTICAQNRKYLFGEIVNRKVDLNSYGEIVKTLGIGLQSSILMFLLMNLL